MGFAVLVLLPRVTGVDVDDVGAAVAVGCGADGLLVRSDAVARGAVVPATPSGVAAEMRTGGAVGPRTKVDSVVGSAVGRELAGVEVVAAGRAVAEVGSVTDRPSTRPPTTATRARVSTTIPRATQVATSIVRGVGSSAGPGSLESSGRCASSLTDTSLFRICPGSGGVDPDRVLMSESGVVFAGDCSG